MVKTVAQLQDIDTSLETRLPAIVQLPKVAAPYTTVQNRALVTNFAADLLPRFGIERFMTQAYQEIQGEYGPNGERVFKPVNDVHDAVRIVGSPSNTVGVNGQAFYTGSTTSDYIEITYYGTGLNILTITDVSARVVSVSTDGVSDPSVTISGASFSGVISGRNYSTNTVVNITSGKSLGLHTTKITWSSGVQLWCYGYEVLNTTSTLQQLPGSSYAGGQRLYASALTTSSPTSGFTNTYGTPSVPSRGGHVLVYQKSDGTIAKDIRYTETAPAYLTSANHTNEEVVRTYHWREFGAGRADDFSSLTTSTADRAFTLDDGTTTLVGNQVANTSGSEVLLVGGIGSFITLTFVGTGLDVLRQDDSTVVDPYSVTVDGVNQGNLAAIGVGGSPRLTKLVSGLPYGTHTVKITRTTAAIGAIRFVQFVVYAPRIPALPTGAVALADYFVMADYAADTTYGNAYRVSTGVMRKMLIREAIYSGTWAIASLDPGFAAGFNLRSNTAASYVELTFVGTGIEFRPYIGNFALNWTFQIDGAAPTGSSFTYQGSGLTYTAGTGVLSGTAAGAANYSGGVWLISGLTFGVHKLRVTYNSGADYLYTDAFNIITPIHAPKLNGPFVVQNTLPVGSCAVRDLRNFSEDQIPKKKVCSQAVGVSNSQTTTVTTSPGVPIADMSTIVHVKSDGLYSIFASVPVQGDGANLGVQLGLVVDGQLVSNQLNRVQVANQSILLNHQFVIGLAPGVHKVDAYWWVGSGTGSIVVSQKVLTVREI